MKAFWFHFLVVAFLVLWPEGTPADIYKYIDSDGVLHFTNVPTSSGYQLYLKEKSKNSRNYAGSKTYDRLIENAQKKHGIDFHLIKAVINVESAFDPKAVSKKGAKGLMQIMPSNFKSLYLSDPFNPSENIMAGTLYLKRLFKKYGNKLGLVLAAYNAGPEAVDKYKAIPPFDETQNYVRKVMETYNHYKRS